MPRPKTDCYSRGVSLTKITASIAAGSKEVIGPLSILRQYACSVFQRVVEACLSSGSLVSFQHLEARFEVRRLFAASTYYPLQSDEQRQGRKEPDPNLTRLHQLDYRNPECSCT